jgi:hypothetical protein
MCIPEDAKEILKEQFEESMNIDLKFELREMGQVRLESSGEDLPFTLLDIFWAGYKYAKKTYML